MSNPGSISLDNNTLSAIKMMMRDHRSEMTQTISSMMDRIGGSGMGAMGGFRRGGGDLNDVKKELEAFLSVMKKNRQTLSATEKFQSQMAEKELKAVKDKIDALKSGSQAQDQHTESTEKGTEAKKKNTKTVEDATQKLSEWARGIATGTLSFQAVTRAVDEFQQAYKTGLNWNALGDSIESAFKMGMSPKEMMELQAQYRRVSNTLDGGIDSFTKGIAANQSEWKKFTGSLRDSAFAQAQFSDTALSMGINSKDLDNAVGGLFSEFKRLQVITGNTSDQFVSMVKALGSETSVRTKLVGLQSVERKNYMLGLSQTNSAFRALGLQEDVALQTIKMIESQTTNPAKDRLKQSFMLQREAKMYGMDDESAATLARLSRKQALNESERVQKAQLAAIFAQAQRGFVTSGAMNNDIFTNEMRMNRVSGMNPLSAQITEMGTNVTLAEGAVANQETLIKQQADIAARNEGLQGEIIEQITKFSNIFSAWGATALAALIGGSFAAAKWGGDWGGGSGGSGGGAGGRAGKMKALWSALGKGARGGLVGLAAGAIGGVGQMIADPQTDEKKNFWDEGTGGAALGAAIGTAIAPGIGTALGALIGGGAGLAKAWAENGGLFNSVLDREKKAMTERMDNATLLFNYEQNRYNKELATLRELEKGEDGLTQKQRDRITELNDLLGTSKKKFEAASAKQNADQFVYSARNVVELTNTLKKTAETISSNGTLGISGYGTTKDVDEKLSEIQSRMKLAGVDMTQAQLREMLGERLGTIMAEKNISSIDAIKTQEAILSGANHDYSNSSVNPLIGEALSQMMPDLTKQINSSLQASFNERFNNEEQLSKLQTRINELSSTAEKDRQLVEMAKTMPGVGGAAAAQQRLDESQQLATLLQQLVTQDTNGTTISVQQKELLEQIAGSLDTIAKSTRKMGSSRR